MKRTVKTFIAIWVVLMVAFVALSAASLVIGLTSDAADKAKSLTASDYVTNLIVAFALRVVFVAAMLVAQLVCFVKVYKVDSTQKRFYAISLKKASYVQLGIAGVLSIAFAAIPFLLGDKKMGQGLNAPYLFVVVSIVAAAVSVLLLIINLIIAISTRSFLTEVESIDEKTANKTRFSENLAADVEYLATYAKSEATKAACASVYDAVRYADPTVDASIQAIENVVAIKFADLDYAVKADDAEKATEVAHDIVALLMNRDNKCELAL